MSADSLPIVCVQGLGYVGAAMALTIADARSEAGPARPRYSVEGVDLDTPSGRQRIDALRAGRFPFDAADPELDRAAERVHRAGNLQAGCDPSVFERASVVVVDVPFHIESDRTGRVRADFPGFLEAIRIVGERIPPDALVIVESTVPPGTCEHRVLPLLRECFRARDIGTEPRVAHSYERVMPGPDYYDSIRNFWRVYAGCSDTAAEHCEKFLRSILNTETFPLTRLHSTTASETAKALENTFRASTIAMIDEWGRFAEHVGVDLHAVIDAIRVRPTHQNIRQPGFGVGGYCLTKDPLLGVYAAREIFDAPSLSFPFAERAVASNRELPRLCLERLEALLGGELAGRRVLLCGVSYRSEVGDTRYSPSEDFVRQARERGAEVVSCDPWVAHWVELGEAVADAPPSPADFDAVVLAVPHEAFQRFDWLGWSGSAEAKPLILDANRVLDDEQRRALRDAGLRVESTGRGAGL